MSDFNAACSAMDATLFDAFGDDVTVQRGADGPVSVRAVFTRGVERFGDYGQVVARVTTASFLNSEWIAQQGDVVTLPEGGSRKVEIPEDKNDGFVNVAVLHG